MTVGADVSAASATLNGFSQTITKVGNSIQNAGRDLTAGITAPIAGSVGIIGKFGKDFEDSMSKVRKNVGLTKDETADLGKQILDLSVTTAAGGRSADELAGIASVAGQLGVAKKDLLDFTKASALLAGATGIAPEEAASNLGIIATLTHTGAAEWLGMVNVISGLGNDLAGSEKDILDTATRIAGALTNVGVKPEQILAISSALGAVGINPEAGGTAISQFFIGLTQAVAGTGAASEQQIQKIQNLQDRIADLGSSLQTATERQQQFGRNTPASVIKQNADQIERYKREIGQAQEQLTKLQAAAGGGGVESFAKTAGLSVDEFKKLFREDPAAAFQKIIQGLSNLSQTGGPEAVTKALADMGITGAREVQAILGLATGVEQLDKAFTIANTQMHGGTAALDENAAAAETTSRKFDLMVQQLKKMAIEAWPALQAAAADAMSFFTTTVIPKLQELKDKWDNLDPSMQRNILLFAGIASALGPALVVLGVLVTALGALFSPLILAAVLIGVLAALWISNWEGIRDKAGAAMVAVAGFLKNDLGNALRVLLALAIVVAPIIAGQLGLMAIAWGKAAAAALVNAGRMAVAWAIAFAPAVAIAGVVIGVIALIIAAVALLRKAWDSNFGGIRDKIAEVAGGLADFLDMLSTLPGFLTKALFFGASPEDLKGAADAARQFSTAAKAGQSAVPQFQGAADALDAGGQFLDQFKQGFPDLQASVAKSFSGGIADNAGLLATAGIPDASIGQAIGTSLTREGPQPLTSADLANISVVINNPAVFDQSMLGQLTDQMQNAVIDALVGSERTVSLPQPSLVPGQPF